MYYSFPGMLSHRNYSLELGMRSSEFLSRISQYPVAEYAMKPWLSIRTETTVFEASKRNGH